MFGYDTDLYLGYKVLNFGESKSFRVEKYKDRWFFVTPEGHPYLLIGANHSDFQQTLEMEKLLKKRYGKKENLAKELSQEMKAFGFNAAFHGYYNGIEKYIPVNDVINCTRNNYYKIQNEFFFDDVFDHVFKKDIKKRIEIKCKEVKNNPRYLGYIWTQAPRWDIDISRASRGYDWVTVLRTLPFEKPGYQMYKKYISKIYKENIEKFNRVYGQRVTNFEQNINFSFIDKNNSQIRNDDEGFLRIIAHELFSYIYQTIKQYDDSHINYGDKFLLYDHPDCVLEEISPYVDVIAIQPGGGYNEMPFTPKDQPYYEKKFRKKIYDHINQLTGKPIVIADYNISFKTKNYPKTSWYQCSSEKEAANMYCRYMIDAFKQPYIIGFSHCEYFSKYKMKKDYYILRQGVISPSGTPYINFITKFKRTSNKIIRRVLKVIRS